MALAVTPLSSSSLPPPLPQRPVVRARRARLIVQPGDSFIPIEESIEAARSEVCATVYKMDCPVVKGAFLRAASRGVRVRIILSSRIKDDFQANRELRAELAGGGVEAEFPRGRLGALERYHAKMLLVDGREVSIFTFNPTEKNLHAYRDFGVRIEDDLLVAALRELFDSDWGGEDRQLTSIGIAASPGRSRGPINTLLASAARRIWVYDAKIADPVILDTLIRKARQGVDVRVMTSTANRSRLPEEVRPHSSSKFHLHAKLTLVDDRYLFIGSQNLHPLYLDHRREIGVLLDCPDLAHEVAAIFLGDWGEELGREQGETVMIASGTEIPGETYVLMSRRHCDLRFAVGPGRHTIGRSVECSLRLSHPSVSRYHAEVRSDGQRLFVRDFSKLGTSVNGERVEGERELSVGDVVSFGGWEEFRLLWL